MTGRTKRMIRAEAPYWLMGAALLAIWAMSFGSFIGEMETATAGWIQAREALWR